MCITSQLTFECSIIRMRIYASSIRNTIQLITCLSSRGNSRILTTTKNSVSSWNVGRPFTNDSRLAAVLQDQGSYWYTACWSHKRKTFFPQSSPSPARWVSMRWININVSHQHPINTVLSYIIWKIWWDLTDFRVSNDFSLFFFLASVIVFGTVMFLAGFIVSAAFASLFFMLWSAKREHRLLDLQGRVNDLEAQAEQMIAQPPLPLAPMVGLGEGPGEQDQGYQSGEE